MKYSVAIFQNALLNDFRQIRLKLESGVTAVIVFPKIRPADWLQFDGSNTTLSMAEDQFTDLYHLLQSERPVFYTAINSADLGIQVGTVASQSLRHGGEPPGEGYEDQSLDALIQRATRQKPGA